MLFQAGGDDVHGQVVSSLSSLSSGRLPPSFAARVSPPLQPRRREPSAWFPRSPLIPQRRHRELESTPLNFQASRTRQRHMQDHVRARVIRHELTIDLLLRQPSPSVETPRRREVHLLPNEHQARPSLSAVTLDRHIERS